jgi:hypothetical protein
VDRICAALQAEHAEENSTNEGLPLWYPTLAIFALESAPNQKLEKILASEYHRYTDPTYATRGRKDNKGNLLDYGPEEKQLLYFWSPQPVLQEQSWHSVMGKSLR